MSLSVCGSCQRHARGDVCPFCGCALPPPSHSEVVGRIGRAALVATAAGIAASACHHSFVQPYGEPVFYEDASPALDADTDGGK